MQFIITQRGLKSIVVTCTYFSILKDLSSNVIFVLLFSHFIRFIGRKSNIYRMYGSNELIRTLKVIVFKLTGPVSKVEFLDQGFQFLGAGSQRRISIKYLLLGMK